MPSDQSRPLRWERVHIFISSTFNDMHAERDYLVKRVFPQLADWCDARRLRMVDVDLRWGVTEQDATRNRGVVQVCLRRIDESRPFFLCFLGQRYGWVPRPSDVSDETLDEYTGLADELIKGRSVTEIEILHAIVRPFAPDHARARSDQALFYVRHPAAIRNLPREPRQLWRTFTDRAELDDTSRAFLLSRRAHLRKVTIPSTGRPVAVYTGKWNPAARSPELEMPLRCPVVLPENIDRWRSQWRDAGVQVDGLDVAEVPAEEAKARAFNASVATGRLAAFAVGEEPLAVRVLRDLQTAIEARFPGRVPQQLNEPLAIELAQQEQFQFAAAEGFIERAGDFDALDEYAASASDRPFVLTAPAGTGKSMLLARWLDRLRAHNEGPMVVYRFVGASDLSTSVASLLDLLCDELKESVVKPGETLPHEPDRLRQMWPALLARAGADRELIVVIDALDQLQSGLFDLTWVPRRLPPGVKVVVSFRRDAARADLALQHFRTGGAVLGEVRPFESADDRRRLVRAYLAQYLKELDERHLEALVAARGAENPLYLKVVLSELRVFGAFMNLGEKIANDFGAAPESAFAGVLRRLETDPAYAAIEPAAAVPLIFGTLATARRGLSADEIARLLCNAFARDPRDPVLFEEALDTAHLILRQVRPFLARRGGRHDFFYDAFRRAALARYVGATRAGARTEAAWHTLLADYFHTLPLWRRPAGAAARTPDERRVGELPYHLTLAGDGKRLGKILGDLDFIEAKCHAGLTYELLDDYLRIPEPLRTDSLDQFREFVRAQAHVLKQWPELTFQQAANTVEAGTMYGQSAPAKASVYRQLMGMESRPWLRRLNPAPTAGACVMTMSGHDGSVLSVTVSPTGERAISVGVDATLRIWDLRTGSAMETLRDVVGKSPHLAPIPGSTRIAVWGKDSRIVVWDYSVLQPIAEFAAPRHGVSCLSADATGHFLVAGTDTLPGDKTGDPVHSVVVCDLQTGLPVDIGPFTRPTSAVAIANGGRVLYAASGNKLEAYDTRAKRMTAERTMQTEQITSVRLAPDEASLATCGWGGVIETWSADSLAPIRSFSGSRQGIVWAIAYSPDGREIAAAGLDGTIVIWDIATGKSITRLRGHTDSITAISYTPEGSWLVTCGADGTVRLWDPQFDRSFFALARQQMTERFGGPTGRADPDRAALEMETLLFALSSSRKHFNAVLGVTAAASGRRGVSVSLDDTIRIWNMETGEFVHVLEGHENGVAGVTASADGQRIATSDRSGTVKVWDVESGEELATRSMVGGPAETKDTSLVAQLAQETRRPVVLPLRFVAGGKLLATADSLGHAVKIWDAETLEPYLILAGHTGRVRSLMTGDHKMTLVSSGDDGAVIAWNLDSGEISARLEVPIAANVSAQAAPICMIGDGRVACAWPDGSIRLFNPGTMASTGELRGSEGRVRSLSAAADLIVATRLAPDGVVIDVWRGAQAAPVHIERCGSGSTVASLHADTRRLAIVGPDGLLVRDLDDKRALRRYPVQVSCAAFAGQRVIAAGAGISGEVYLLEATG